jgi:hypothetical protein
MAQPARSAGTLIQRTPCVWRAQAIDLVPATWKTFYLLLFFAVTLRSPSQSLSLFFR